MKISGLKAGRLAIVVWLLSMLACLGVISRSQFTADLSAFLPRSPMPEQQLLVDQLRDGVASRLILVGIEGADETARAKISLQMARQLRANPAFISIHNGEETGTERDRAYLFDHRYLLSPAVTPEHFSVDGLHRALNASIERLSSPAGLLIKSLLPHDPTGEMLQLLQQMDNGNRPQLMQGAWASADGKTALLLAQTRAAGSDTEAQKQAMTAIDLAFTQAAQALQATNAKLHMTGPGVFSVLSRDTIKREVRLIFIISTLLIAALLLLAYRSLSALLLGFLPVASGIAAGIAAVSLGFGVVHGITLGFGTALIGEAVDYSIYLFMQAERGAAQRWMSYVWPTIRLGVLTSIFGFASLLLSGFPGLAQLGLYSIAGLIAAAAMTRFVLPHLLPAGFQVRDVSAIGRRLAAVAQYAARLRWFAIAWLAAACLVVYSQRDHLWNHELSALSPVSAAEMALDARLRAAMGAPDVRYVVVATGDSQEAALRAAEQVAAALQPLVQQGALAGFESPSRYLPSQSMQQARQASLPAADELRSHLEQAISGLPVKAQLFAPFVADVEKARQQRLLQRSDLAGTSMALALDAMLINSERGWNALLPLSAPASGHIDSAQVQAAIKGTQAFFIDIKAESDRLYSGYLHEAIMLSLAGLAAIVVLLLIVLRSPARVLRVIAPLAAAVITVTALLALLGQQLIILHLIGLLLVVAIGSNYALFFDRGHARETISPRTFASLLFANIATVLGFGLLAFASVPVLQALGVTVAPGVILALIFSAIF
ncbi:MAG TPA: MMPL family transporter, partial [Methylophilaceae bacterium]|nr:MMPL family transporter [Methylophilaceae bacterium]